MKHQKAYCYPEVRPLKGQHTASDIGKSLTLEELKDLRKEDSKHAVVDIHKEKVFPVEFQTVDKFGKYERNIAVEKLNTDFGGWLNVTKSNKMKGESRIYQIHYTTKFNDDEYFMNGIILGYIVALGVSVKF